MRNFTFAIRTKGNNVVIIPSDLELELVRTVHAQGTYHSCEISAVGNPKALWQLLGYLGNDITVMDDRGEMFWNGYINDVNIEFGIHSFGRTLDDMYNRVRAISGNESVTSTITGWHERNDSIIQFGVKELQVSTPDFSPSQTAQALETILEENGVPQDTITINQSSRELHATATIICYGYMQTLGWTYYENPYGIVDTWERTDGGLKIGQSANLFNNIIIEDRNLKYVGLDTLRPFDAYQEGEAVHLLGIAPENVGKRIISRVTDGREIQFTTDLSEDSSNAVTIRPDTDWVAIAINLTGTKPWHLEQFTVPVTAKGTITQPLRARIVGAPFTGGGVPTTVIAESTNTIDGTVLSQESEEEVQFTFNNVALQPGTLYWIAFYVATPMPLGGYWIGTGANNGYPVSFRHTEDSTWNVNYPFLGIPFKLLANWPLKTLLEDIVSEAQFFNSIWHNYTVPDMVLPFRDGSTYALVELQALLPGARLQARLDIERNFVIRPERDKDEFEYYLYKDGNVRHKRGDRIPQHLVQSGTYFKLADIAFVNSALDAMENLSYVWIEMVTYNAAQDRATLTARAELKVLQSL